MSGVLGWVAAWMVATSALGQVGTSVTTVGGGNALSTVTQRHMVRVVRPGRAPTYLLAVERDTQGSPDPQGLHWYRSDDEGKSWRYYQPILETSLHLAADAMVVGNDVAIVVSYDTTETGFPSDSRDPNRKVYFQWWRDDGQGGFTPGPLQTIASPASGYAYHRAVLARDSLGRIWVSAWLRDPCSSSAGASCGDTLRLWVSTDGGASFTAQPSLVHQDMLGGGSLISLGNRLMLIWGDYSWDNPAQIAIRDDSAALDSWDGPFDAFSDGDSIYHGAAQNAVADGAGGLHLVYKDRNENLYYRHFDGAKFGGRTWVDGTSGTTDWAVQPALTLFDGDLYVCTNHPTVAGQRHELRSYRLSNGFQNPVILDSTSTFKGYPTAPSTLSSDARGIPCAYAAYTGPSDLRVAVRPVTASNPTPDFSIVSSPTDVVKSGTATVTLTPKDGFSGAIVLSLSGVPVGATASLSQSSVNVGPDPKSVTLTLDAGTAAPGSWAVTVKASSGALSHAVSVGFSIPSAGGSKPLLESLSDPFLGPGVNSSLWTVTRLVSGDNASASNGELVLTPVPSNGDSGVFVTTSSSYVLTGSRVQVNVKNIVSGAGGINCRMRVHRALPGGWSDDAGFWFESGVLYAYVTKAGDASAVATTQFSATQHAWWRMREAAGTLYWETSKDGASWNVFGSIKSSSLSFSLDDVYLSFEIREFGSGNPNPGSAHFASLNSGGVATNPDAGTPDAGVADAGSPVLDAGTPDAGSPDAGVADAGSPIVDAGTPDAGSPDAGIADAGSPVVDAGTPDAGSPDAGSRDAGVLDGGASTADAGSPDAGPPIADAGTSPDAGTFDAGVADAGNSTPDAGTPPSGNPPISTLLDPFTGTSIDATRWDVHRDTSGSTASESQGALVLSLQLNSSNAGVHVTSKAAYSLVGSSIHVRALSLTGITAPASTVFVVAAGLDEYHQRLGFWFERGTLYLFSETPSGVTTVATFSYSPTTHAWWRLSEVNGTVYWETSADGTTWTQRASLPVSKLGFSLGSVNARFSAKAWGPSSNPGTVRFGSLNSR